MFRNMFKKTYTKLNNEPAATLKGEVPEGMWRKCRKCKAPIYVEDVRSNYYACPKCQEYFRMHAYRRIEMLVDKNSFKEWNKSMPISNPLNFPGYEEKLSEARAKSRLDEAVVTGRASIDGLDFVIAVCDARFMMSSMGRNVGEKITYAVERATEEHLNVVIYSCSGGARMQEGIVSLMQMAKTSAALKRLRNHGLTYISVLTDPTTGGVTASFAMLGDIILAEPKALIGFAGPRVIAQTIGAKLPEGFQRSEFLLEHGFIDAIVERKDQRDVIKDVLTACKYRDLVDKKYDVAQISSDRLEDNINTGDKSIESRGNVVRMPDSTGGRTGSAACVDISHKKTHTAWESVLLSRDKNRPTAKDYIDRLFTKFLELHGDRYYADDGAIIGGLAFFRNTPIMVIAQQKGRSIKENKLRNFGMPSPEGYRKALRLMKLAESMHIPIICLVDTPGAFCGIEAEERGQGEAIAGNLYEMSDIATPILSIVIGEGGSGGALAMAVSDEVWMLEHAIYSILSPEGFASILYKDAKKCKEAAELMKITSDELMKLGIIERIIPEASPAHTDNMDELISCMEAALHKWIDKSLSMDVSVMLDRRYNRYRKY